MCGIAGRYNFRTRRPVDQAGIVGMCDLIAHRGPDEAGVFVDGAIGLGHRRLSIIDLTPTGRQPMTSANGLTTIVFNGEIYNFLDLRRDLEARGHRFRGHSDTEVLLSAYEEFGVECLSKLRGMFAFAVWDARDRSLFIARDRVGKKPLHYRMDGDGIAFASEAKAFFAEPSFSASPNLEAISHYLTLPVRPKPALRIRRREQTAAGQLSPRQGRERFRHIDTGDSATRRSSGSPKTMPRAKLLTRLTEAVRLRMISDVPLGAFLSGGIDSSAVVALMAQVSSGPVKTYSIGFEEKDYDELPFARLVASDTPPTITSSSSGPTLPPSFQRWHGSMTSPTPTNRPCRRTTCPN